MGLLGELSYQWGYQLKPNRTVIFSIEARSQALGCRFALVAAQMCVQNVVEII
jgi:hypothetical protein